MLGQVLGHDGSRNTDVFRERAIHVQSRCDDRCLDGVQHIEAIRQLTKAVPTLTRLQHPGFALLDTLFGQIIRAPDLEPPAFAPLLIDLAHGAAEVEGFGNRFFNQGRATRLFHHRCRDITGGNNRVLRRS